MIYGLKTATNNPNIESILLFEDTRFKSGINNDGAFSLIMQSMDAINQQCSIANQNNVRISAENCMTLPVSVICEMEDKFNEELNFLTQNTAKKSLVQHFFTINWQNLQISFKNREGCPKPNILAKIKRLNNNNTLRFKQFFKIHLQHDSDTIIPQPYHFSSYINQMQFNQKQNNLRMMLQNNQIHQL